MRLVLAFFMSCKSRFAPVELRDSFLEMNWEQKFKCYGRRVFAPSESKVVDFHYIIHPPVTCTKPLKFMKLAKLTGMQISNETQGVNAMSKCYNNADGSIKNTYIFLKM